MSQMNTEKKSMRKLDLNPGQLVRLVPDWVICCVGLSLGVTLSANNLCDGDGVSLFP